MKKEKLRIIIGIILFLILMNAQQKESKKMAETMVRTFSSTSVNSGSQVTVTISGGSGFTGIIETLPAGWSIVDTGDEISQSGQEVRAYFMGASYTYTAIAGTTLGNVTFNGVFESSGNTSGNIGGTSTIEVISSSGCTQSSECITINDCLIPTCSNGQCEYTHEPNGTECSPTGTCQSGTCVENQTQCTPTIWLPLSDSACNAVSFQQTSNCNTSRTAVGTKINASCSNSNECSSGSKKCVGVVRYECADTDSDSFLEWKVAETCANGCTNGICNTSSTPSEPTCSFYQTLSDGECKTSGVAYLVIGAAVLLIVFSSLRRR